MRNGLKRAAAFALTILMLLTLLPAALATESVTTSDAVVPGLSLATVEPDYRGMFDELMAADGAAFEELAAVYMADEGFLAWVDQAVASGEMTEDEYAAFAEKINAGISTMDIGGKPEITIAVGEEVTLTSDEGRNGHSWQSSNSSVASVDGNGRTATITGISAGTARITHNYGREGSESINVTVQNVVEAAIYYLTTPGAGAGSNDTSIWCDAPIMSAKVSLANATWAPSAGVEADDPAKNIFIIGSNDRISYFAGMEWSNNYNGYRLTDTDRIAEIYRIYNGNDGNVEVPEGVEVYLVPYKISRNNGTREDVPDAAVHVDCTVLIVDPTDRAYRAQFEVVYPNRYQVTAEETVYEMDENVRKTDAAPGTNRFPTTYVDSSTGITYEFDGWYNEAGEKVSEDDAEGVEGWQNGYAPSEDELEDLCVYFYAYYVPKEAPVTVTKTVAGEETDESFAFEYTITNPDGTTVSDTFELNHGGEAEISVPNGAKFEVTETSADGYTTSYVINNEDEPVSGNKATIGSVPVEGATIAFTNTRNTVDVTIEKQVTGNMGDRSKGFEFVLSGEDADGNTLKFSVSQSGGFTVAPNGNAKIEFTLKHGQSVALTGLPINAVLNIREENADGYNMSVLYPSGEDGVRNEDIAATADGVIIPEVPITVLDGGTITVTNNKEATPDTGIVTDSLPYIVILACVVAIGAVVIVRRRGRRDE